jgi:hypothetical protein
MLLAPLTVTLLSAYQPALVASLSWLHATFSNNNYTQCVSWWKLLSLRTGSSAATALSLHHYHNMSFFISANASHAQFRIKGKISKILRSNKTLHHKLAKVYMTLKLIPPVERSIPELFKYATLFLQWDSKIYHPAQKTGLFHFEALSNIQSTQSSSYFEQLWAPIRCPWLLNHYVGSYSHCLHATRNRALVTPFWEGNHWTLA